MHFGPEVAGLQLGYAEGSPDGLATVEWADGRRSSAVVSYFDIGKIWRGELVPKLCKRSDDLAFWLHPDWSGGNNMRDPGAQPFWMLPPLPDRAADVEWVRRSAN